MEILMKKNSKKITLKIKTNTKAGAAKVDKDQYTVEG
jgi:hypothetical protein